MIDGTITKIEKTSNGLKLTIHIQEIRFYSGIKLLPEMEDKQDQYNKIKKLHIGAIQDITIQQKEV